MTDLKTYYQHMIDILNKEMDDLTKNDPLMYFSAEYNKKLTMRKIYEFGIRNIEVREKSKI